MQENALEAPANEEAGVHEASAASAGDSIFPQKQTFGAYLRPNRSEVSRQGAQSRDVIDCGIISMATARQLFETYRNNLCPHYPMVPIPDSISADQMRATKPTLFLAMITSAAGVFAQLVDHFEYADTNLSQAKKTANYPLYSIQKSCTHMPTKAWSKVRNHSSWSRRY